jgi:hypothetical protein
MTITCARLTFLLAALALPAACGHERARPGPAPPRAQPERRPAASVSSTRLETTVRGTARDAKAGAVVITADQRVVYVEGLTSWPGGVSGRQVAVTGVLQRKKSIPDPVGPDGSIAQGAVGEQEVLTSPVWQVVVGP